MSALSTRITLVFSCLCLLCGMQPRCLAQGEGFGGTATDEIETDRDSFTPATTTAGPGRWILEAAYSFIDNRSVPETHSFPEVLLRRGIGENLELRFGWNYEVGGAGNPVSGNSVIVLPDEAELERESRMLYGMKALLLDQEGWVPASSVLLQGFTPTSGDTSDTQISATYIFGWELPSSLLLDSAIRYSTSSLDEDQFNVWSPSTVVKIPIGDQWKAHLEYFGIYSEGRAQETAQYFISPGAHYLITSDVEVGVRVGWGLNQQSPNFFSNAGLGWRF
ncbi:transporter [Stieleria sp. TO1_6]|uniref:transporter n=1 Tax=Stieleria tagensis TaxID=2956795 RepID=UPI00209ADA86|nr:transporter [Stieleria tagensis]MCO8124185.1 transporter [Stieleria tagensis]